MSEAVDLLRLLGQLDVVTLGVLSGLGFYRILRSLHAIEVRLALNEQHTNTILKVVEEHSADDKESHRSIWVALREGPKHGA